MRTSLSFAPPTQFASLLPYALLAMARSLSFAPPTRFVSLLPYALLAMARGGAPDFGGLAIGIVVAIVVASIGVLLGGVLMSQINTQFSNFNLTGTAWADLANQLTTIGTSALGIVILGILVVAFMAIIYIFRGR